MNAFLPSDPQEGGWLRANSFHPDHRRERAHELDHHSASTGGYRFIISILLYPTGAMQKWLRLSNSNNQQHFNQACTI